jgi:hypothetical protein
MIPSSKRLVAAFAAVLLGCVPSSARADDFDYLPNGASHLLSIDLAGFFKSKVYQEFKKQSPKVAQEIEGSKGGGITSVHIPIAGIARFTHAGALAGNYEIITTSKQVTAAGIKEAQKSSYPDYTYEETRVGTFTVNREKFRLNPKGAIIEGNAFCLVADKTILARSMAGMDGVNLEALRKILERTKKPELSAEFQKAVEHVGFANTIGGVLDYQKSLAGEVLTESIRKDAANTFPGMVDITDKIQIVTLKVNVADDVKGTATAACKDAASAADLKKSLAAGLVNLKKLLPKDDPKLTAKQRDLIKAANTALDAVKLSAKGTQVEANVVLEPAVAVMLVRGLFEFETAAAPRKVESPPKEK